MKQNVPALQLRSCTSLAWKYNGKRSKQLVFRWSLGNIKRQYAVVTGSFDVTVLIQFLNKDGEHRDAFDEINKYLLLSTV
jgi:hypothetical protein